MNPPLLRPGNKKLGTIANWSIPAGAEICVGSSSLCRKSCYALSGHYRFGGVKQFLQRNLQLANSKEFVSLMSSELRHSNFNLIRIHVSGDFYSEVYIDKWITLINRYPEITFYAYTRSWNSDLLPALKRLAKSDNLHLWWSCDKETKAPPRVKNVRRAYMAIDDEDIPKFKTDMVFRVNRNKVQKKINGSLVCPPENGITKTTCTKCRLCFTALTTN